jgi:hypothetical protein
MCSACNASICIENDTLRGRRVQSLHAAKHKPLILAEKAFQTVPCLQPGKRYLCKRPSEESALFTHKFNLNHSKF